MRVPALLATWRLHWQLEIVAGKVSQGVVSVLSNFRFNIGKELNFLQTIMAEDLELTTPPLKPPLHNSSRPKDKEPEDSDIEKIRKWQEERIARKLRGEYESAVLHLTEVVSRIPHSVFLTPVYYTSHQRV